LNNLLTCRKTHAATAPAIHHGEWLSRPERIDQQTYPRQAATLAAADRHALVRHRPARGQVHPVTQKQAYRVDPQVDQLDVRPRYRAGQETWHQVDEHLQQPRA